VSDGEEAVRRLTDTLPPDHCTQCGKAWEARACGPTHAALWQEIRCVEAVETLFYFKPVETFTGWRAVSLIKAHTTMDTERAEKAIERWRAWRKRRGDEAES
jgi:hypothetical protein